MQKTVLDSSVLNTHVLRRVFLLYSGLAIVSVTFSYLGGGYRYSSLYTLLGWIQAAALAAILDYSRWLYLPPRRGLYYNSLFLAPALVQIGQDIANVLSYRAFDRIAFLELIFLLLFALSTGLAVLAVGLLRSTYIGQVTHLTTAATALEVNVPPANDVPSIPTVSLGLLGRSGGYIDRVINSVIERSMKSERQANFSLTIMLILVMIGGMASFGLWAFTHADRISTLEAERNKLIALQEGFKDARDKLDPNNVELKERLDRLIKFIEQNYSNSESYKDSLSRLSQQSQTNYADIAIRVTIAVLTIFLVQVFFAVYKYNRHLANMLAAKAEALELAGNDEDSRKELSREAVSIVKESVPGFGASPRTPLEEIVQAADKLRK